MVCGSSADWLINFILFCGFYFGSCVASSTTDKCALCGFLVESFNEGLKKTDHSHFAGGDTAWELEKLGKYKRSETRLLEVFERICKKSDATRSAEEKLKDIKETEPKCHAMVEEHEEKIESWFFHKQANYPDFFNWLCIRTIQACCPEFQYGPDCLPCPGDPARPCFGNGKCDGAGSRQGTGKCTCDYGYLGNLCRKCATSHFYSLQNETHVVCEACDISCKLECSSGGPKGCLACKSGYIMTEEKGCEDIDECADDAQLCTGDHEECINSAGSYSCVCQKGYTREKDICVLDIQEETNKTEEIATAAEPDATTTNSVLSEKPTLTETKKENKEDLFDPEDEEISDYDSEKDEL